MTIYQEALKYGSYFPIKDLDPILALKELYKFILNEKDDKYYLYKVIGNYHILSRKCEYVDFVDAHFKVKDNVFLFVELVKVLPENILVPMIALFDYKAEGPMNYFLLKIDQDSGMKIGDFFRPYLDLSEKTCDIIEWRYIFEGHTNIELSLKTISCLAIIPPGRELNQEEKELSISFDLLNYMTVDQLKFKINFLKEMCKEYYKLILPSYAFLLTRLLNFEDVQELGLIPNGLSKLAYKISLFNIPIQAYFLGLPIHLGLPSKSIIDSFLSELSTLGLEEYSKKMGYEFVSYYGGKLIEYNTEDFYAEEISGYSSFDVISYIEGGFLYHFTRGSFDNISSTENNPYNRTPVTATLLNEINLRKAMATEYGFPDAGTIKNNLEKLNSN